MAWNPLLDLSSFSLCVPHLQLLQAGRVSLPTLVSQWTHPVTQRPISRQKQATVHSTPAALCTASAAGCSNAVAARPLNLLACPVQQSPGTCSLTPIPQAFPAPGVCFGDAPAVCNCSGSSQQPTPAASLHPCQPA